MLIAKLTEEEVNEMKHEFIRICDQYPASVYNSHRFIPMEEAGERIGLIGLSREWVNFLVSTGRLRSAASVSDPQTTLIDVKSIDNLLRDRRRPITTRMAAADLGITIQELFDLISYGHLF